MEHSERPKELGLQLAVSLGLNILAIESNLFADSVTPRLDSLIVNLFLKFLSMMEIHATYNY